MKRDAIDSIIIGFLATYLPFLEICNIAERITGTIALGIIVFILILTLKKEPQNGNP